MCKFYLLIQTTLTFIGIHRFLHGYRILNPIPGLNSVNFTGTKFASIDHSTEFPGTKFHTADPMYVKHIDEMMFECAIYKDKLTFPSNSTTQRAARSQAFEAEDLMNKVAEEVERARERSKLIQRNINRIKFPIVGKTTKPDTKYLQKIYYILEENNRSLSENTLTQTDKPEGSDRFSGSESQSNKIRTLVQAKNISKVFETPGTHKCVNLFPTFLSSKSPLMPGQESSMVLDDEHKEFLVNEIRESNIFGIFIAFVSKVDQQTQKPEILPNATLCEFVDITNLDKTGVITVRALERFKIGNVIAISDAVINGEVSLLRDLGMVRNPGMAQENSRIIEKLYDRCNLLESEYRRLEGNLEDVEKINSRLKFSEKISQMIENVDFEKEPNLIYELTAFAGLEFHADAETKVWACNTTDTDQRLLVTVDVLKTKIDYLNNLIADKSTQNQTHTQ